MLATAIGQQPGFGEQATVSLLQLLLLSPALDIVQTGVLLSRGSQGGEAGRLH